MVGFDQLAESPGRVLADDAPGRLGECVGACLELTTEPSPFVGQRLTTFISSEDHIDIERLAQHLGAGAVAPVIGASFPLEETVRAVERMEDGHTGGNTVITVARRSACAPHQWRSK